MRMILATVTALTAGLLGVAGPASASETVCHGVSANEFANLSADLTRRQVESQWGAVGLSKWDSERSTPDRDAYTYPACGKHRADITVRVIYDRQSRIWITRVWNRHYV